MDDENTRKSRLAIAAFIMGAIPIAVFLLAMLLAGHDVVASSLVSMLAGVPLCLPAIIMGHMARGRLKRTPERSGKGLATAGLALGYLNMALALAIIHAVILPWYSVWSVKLRGNCQSNLQDMGLVFKMYENENHGQYPILSAQKGRLMFDNAKSPLYPEYLQDLRKLTCPQDKDFEVLLAKKDTPDPNALCNDHSYLYLGYAVTNDAEVSAFADAYRAQIGKGGDFSGDLTVPDGTGAGGANRILRLREDLPNDVLGTNATPEAAAKWTSQIHLLIERPENHVPPGGNVLYLDGHVEFLPYPGNWPMTEKTIGILTSAAE